MGIGRRERVLGWAVDEGGRHVAATESDLLLQRRPPEYERIGWEAIDGVTYSEGVMTVTLVPSEVGGTRAKLRIRLADSAQLPIVVRDRVTSSIVVNEHVTIDGPKGLRVVARRRAGEPDLRWGYVLDQGVSANAELRREAEGLVQRVRLESGVDSV